MVVLVTPEEVLRAQESASKSRLGLCVGVVFLHGMQCGASLGYGGLVLPHHLQPAAASGLLLLDQDQASWFNSVTPVGIISKLLCYVFLMNLVEQPKQGGHVLGRPSKHPCQ